MVQIIFRPDVTESCHHCDHCPGARSSCLCNDQCERGSSAHCLARHAIPCSRCYRPYIVGARYNCLQCCDVSLCLFCFNLHDPAHKFHSISRPGAAPQNVAPQSEGPEFASESHENLPELATPMRVFESVAHDGDTSDFGAYCDWCGKHVRGIGFECKSCHDYHLCEQCYRNNLHDVTHAFKIRAASAYDLSSAQQLRPRSESVNDSVDESVPEKAHCSHCPGWLAHCICAECPRRPGSKCIPVHVNLRCDNCSRNESDFITGVAYHCGNCPEVSLCAKCYDEGAHESSHPFLRRDGPQDSFESLRPRAIGGAIVPWPNQERTTQKNSYTDDKFGCFICKETELEARFICLTCSPNFDKTDPTTLAAFCKNGEEVLWICNQCYQTGMHDHAPQHNFVQTDVLLRERFRAPPRNLSDAPSESCEERGENKNWTFSTDSVTMEAEPASSQNELAALQVGSDDEQQHFYFAKAGTEEGQVSESRLFTKIADMTLEDAENEYLMLEAHQDGKDSSFAKEELFDTTAASQSVRLGGENSENEDDISARYMDLLRTKISQEREGSKSNQTSFPHSLPSDNDSSETSSYPSPSVTSAAGLRPQPPPSSKGDAEHLYTPASPSFPGTNAAASLQAMYAGNARPPPPPEDMEESYASLYPSAQPVPPPTKVQMTSRPKPPPPPPPEEDSDEELYVRPFVKSSTLPPKTNPSPTVGPPPPPPPPPDEDADSWHEDNGANDGTSGGVSAHQYLQPPPPPPIPPPPQQQHQQHHQAWQQHQQNPYQYQYQHQYPGSAGPPAYAQPVPYGTQDPQNPYHGYGKPGAAQKASEKVQQAAKEASTFISSLKKKAKR